MREDLRGEDGPESSITSTSDESGEGSLLRGLPVFRRAGSTEGEAAAVVSFLRVGVGVGFTDFVGEDGSSRSFGADFLRRTEHGPF